EDDVLQLSGVNTNTGSYTINLGSTIQAGSTEALSPNSPFSVTGTLDLNNFNNTILTLNGSGNVTTGEGAGGTLTVSNGGTFSGAITGNGGLILPTGTSGSYTLFLSTSTADNTYSGSTLIQGNATLTASHVNAFSPNTDITLESNGSLDINTYNNTIKSISSESSSSNLILTGAILTINGGQTTTFAGVVSNTPAGGLTIDGGTDLTLTNPSNSYTGATLINDGTLNITVTGALPAETSVTVNALGTLNVTASNSANSITNSGDVIINPGPLALSDFYTQNSGGTLTLGFTSSASPILTAVNDISLTGTLNVLGSGSPTGVYPLIQTSSGDIPTEFTSFTYSGFDSGVSPFLAYSTNDVNLYFADCSSTWNSIATTVITSAWGNADNWNGSCVPGVNGNQNDVANFADFGGAPASITVKVANQFGTAAEALVLGNLNFSATSTQYKITKYNSASSITFDLTGDGAAAINVTGGTHQIDVPLILNIDTNLVLTDGTSLTLTSNTTLTSESTQNFKVEKSGGLGSGTLTNSTELKPYSMSIVSAKVVNNNLIAPTNGLTIAAASGASATVTNSGAGARIGPSGVQADLTVGGNGTTTVVNNGVGASFGPTGAGGDLNIVGPGTTTITNTGVGVRLGPSGQGGNVNLSSGSVVNSEGAVFHAGPSGVFNMSGGSITNDLTSQIGSATEDVIFSGGTLDTTGNVLAYNYTQSGSSILQLNLTSLSASTPILGNVDASGTGVVGSTLIVNALSGSVPSGFTGPIDLVFATKGVSGQYSSVSFLNFPSGVIPDLLYTPNAVQLVVSPTVSSTPTGSLAEVPFTFVNGTNLMIQRGMHELHERMMQRKKYKNKAENEVVSTRFSEKTKETHNISLAALTTSENTQRQEHYLAERVIEKEPNASRFYFGPTGNFGNFKEKSITQQSFGFNSVGLFTGFDHAFNNFGLGVSLDYTKIDADVHHNSGDFTVNQLHGSTYATWTPPSLQALAIDAIAGWGGEWFKINRTAGPSTASVTAKGNTKGMEADALLGVEYIFSNNQFSSMPKNVLFTPFLNAQYMWADINSYEEHNAGIYDLKVKRQSAQSFRSCIGTRFEYLVKGKNYTFKPEFDIAWQREFLDHNRNIYFSTVNLSQTQHISKNISGAGRNTLLLGVDFLITVYEVFEIEMSYDFQWNNLYMNNGFYLGIGGNF
ncbi:MAG: autotransporter domain-containing protein, partial [Verrucomicrobia bacterium]|nr:autotransporter domain-containing protein [Verrucomicrobiota bacterium]